MEEKHNEKWFYDQIQHHSMAVKSLDFSVVKRIAEKIIEVFSRGNKLLLCGNGGSAADAQHIAGEFAGRFRYSDRRPYPALSLPINRSILTALANDYSFDIVFEREVEGTLIKGDAIIGMSTSGNSENVYRALLKAKQLGGYTVAFVGLGGKIVTAAEDVLYVNSNDTPRIQEVHLTAGHVICEMVEEKLYEMEKKGLLQTDKILIPWYPNYF